MRLSLALAVLLASSPALATTYQVGPTRALKTLAAVAPSLKPGDRVELDAATYTGETWIKVSGTAAAPITIQGVGGRPVLAGGVNTIQIQGDHWIVAGLEVTGGTSRCVFVHGHDVTLRDMLIRGCPHHGVLGADNDSGSFLMEYSEVYDCGSGDEYHALYLSTDEVTHPGSVARVQFNFIHNNRGIGLKSRAERNEIFYNWFEGNQYYDVQPIGSQEADEGQAREDSDIVGNVMIRHNEQAAMLLGGDGTGQSFGSYRVAWNTVITASVLWGSPAIRIRDGIESVELHNNVFATSTTAVLDLFRFDAIWRSTRAIAGSNNWIPSGASNVPPEWTGTVVGADPGLGADRVPLATSPLVGRAGPAAPYAAHLFPKPLPTPLFSPTRGRVSAGAPRARATTIGAFEPAGAGTTAAASTGATTTAASTGAGGGAPGTEDPGKTYFWPIAGATLTLAGFLTWLAQRLLLKKPPAP